MMLPWGVLIRKARSPMPSWNDVSSVATCRGARVATYLWVGIEGVDVLGMGVLLPDVLVLASLLAKARPCLTCLRNRLSWVLCECQRWTVREH